MTEGQKSLTLYHGTISWFLPSIIERGLLVGTQLTDAREHAIEYGIDKRNSIIAKFYKDIDTDKVMEHKDIDVVVIKVIVPEEKLKKLQLPGEYILVENFPEVDSKNVECFNIEAIKEKYSNVEE